jgi:hypothetical protein
MTLNGFGVKVLAIAVSMIAFAPIPVLLVGSRRARGLMPARAT